MQCERVPKLQEILVEDPEYLDRGEWKEHLDHCSDCLQEMKALDSSLYVYEQLENPAKYPIDVQVWDAVQSIIYTQKRRWSHPEWQVLLATAVVTLIMGVTGWIYQGQKQFAQIPDHIKVLDMPSTETTQGTHTRVVWNNKQFGLSIKADSQQGNYSSISIGIGLIQSEQALQPKKPSISGFALQKSCSCSVKKDA